MAGELSLAPPAGPESRRHLPAATLQRVTAALSATLELPEILELICRETAQFFGAEMAVLWLVRGEQLVGLAGHGPGRDSALGKRIPLSAPNDPACQAIQEHQAVQVGPKAESEAAWFTHSQSCLVVPMLRGGEATGALAVVNGQDGLLFGPEAVEIASVLASHAAVAVENARLIDDAKRHVKRLATLHTIDMAISASLDLRVTLHVLLDQVTSYLGIHAADVLLLNPASQTLEYAGRVGFQTGALRHSRLQLGEGYAGRAALERRIISIPNLAQAPGELTRAPLLQGEMFVAYYAVPLVAKAQVKGVLEIFHRSPLKAESEWLDFLETLAGQAALAIDNAELFANLQQANADLAVAYDSTLEGWARALELRDKGTEGHTQRVTNMTLRLARAMGVGDDELVHIRRGALLHDIGKMGIADHILLKTGALTDAEWGIMRRHPAYAHEMLSKIPYLKPALDIPYCHHEKWDGTGYPRGLKGEEIPLAARIFSVVDVWDALRSDRPYRPAWPDDKVISYIRDRSGRYFDSRVVAAFLEMLAEDASPAKR